MQKKAMATIKKYKMLENVKLCYVALSGGADSVCLFNIMREICLGLGIELRIAHVNHNLREDAEHDECFVRGVAEKYGVPIAVKNEEVKELAAEKKIGIEEMGRKIRYAFFEELIAADENCVVALAHTSSDNAETVFFNMLRGAGINGLSGIPPMREGYIRPMIECTRGEVEDYIQNNMLEYSDDITNSDLSYSRNKIRHKLLPFIKEEFAPDLEQRLSNQSEILRGENAFLDSCAEKFVLYKNVKKDYVTVDRDLLASAPTPILHRAVILIVKNCFNITLDYTQSIFCAKQLLRSTNRTLKNFPKGLEVQIEYGEVNFCTGEHTILKCIVDKKLEIGDNKIQEFGTIKIEVTKNLHFGKKDVDKYSVSYDIIKNLSDAELIVRSRMEGDIFKPCGRRSRPLKKMYIDEKIPVSRRDCLPIIEVGGKMVCAYPFGASEEFAVTADTVEILKISFSEGR